MDSSKYRVFVCTKKRAADNPEGCCCDRNALDIYQAFQAEVEYLHLQDKVEIRKSGCLDHCESGAVAMVYQPRRGEFGWLPTKIRVKLIKLLFANRILYGNLQTKDIKEIAKSHLIEGKIYKPRYLSTK